MNENKFPTRLVFIGICLVVFTYIVTYFISRSSIIRKEIITADAVEFNKFYSGAILRTSFGDIEIEFLSKDAPKTVYNFITLAEKNFYNGTKFHYIIKDFLIQGGDPLTKSNDASVYGIGDPGYFLPDEYNTVPIERGVVIMANIDGHTSGSQFFILTAPGARSLKGKSAVFARVIGGFNVIDAINRIATDGIIPRIPVEVFSVVVK